MDEQREIRQFLGEHGLQGLEGLQLIDSTGIASRWVAAHYADTGDATVDILVYPLAVRPETIVEYEERIDALLALANVSGAQRLLAHGRTPALGVIVTCDAEGAEVLETAREVARYDGPRVPLSYHPQLDRILGGDMFRPLQDRWMKATLLSQARAVRIQELVRPLYDELSRELGAGPPAVALPIATLALPSFPATAGGDVAMLSIDELFAIPSLRRAPAEYRELAQMISAVSTPHCLSRALPRNADELAASVRRLFGWLRIAHRMRYTFSRYVSSCLVADFIGVDGSVTDVYYIARDDEQFDELRRRDVGNAVVTASAAASRVPDGAAGVLVEVLHAYAGSRAPSRMEAAARSLGGQFAAGQNLQFEPAFHAFVNSLAAT